MARFPEFADWLSKFRAWSADFDRNQSEAQRCLLSGDLGQLSLFYRKSLGDLYYRSDLGQLYSTSFILVYRKKFRRVELVEFGQNYWEV